MERWMGCDIGEFPFTYLGLPTGENMKRINAWNLVVEKFKKRLGEWKARMMSFGGCLTLVKSVLGSLPLVIKSIYGVSGGLGDVRAMGRERNGGWVWSDIVKIGVAIDGLGLEFSSSCVGVVRDGRDIRFWVDRWVDNRRLCDRFPRLYHLDRRKEASMKERGGWENNNWVWEWDWVRSVRGRVIKKFEELLGVLQHVVIYNNSRDRWRWSLDEDGEFTVKSYQE
ncbi:hypothetical protein Tco_1255156 [Tanacetum coccineum]